MSRSNIDAPTLAALAAANVKSFCLLELAFDGGTVYLCDLAFSVTWSGNTYLPTAGIGSIEAVTETETEARGLILTMSGISAATIATALGEDIQGRSCLLRLAVVDGSTLRVDPTVWRGVLDLMTLQDDGSQPAIRVTAEHEMLAWQRASGALFSDAEQQARFAGDEAFEFASALADATIVWPSAAFFRS